LLTCGEKAKRSLRDNGIVALWIREPTKSNKVHYHLILRNKISRKELEKSIRAALPQKQPGQKRAGWHKSIRLVNYDWQLAHYVTKAKITGYIKGQRVADYYARKRLLFVTGLPFHKVGVIGNFWVKSKTKMWQDVVDVEKRIGAGLDKPNVRRLAQHVHGMLGGYIPLKDIEVKVAVEAAFADSRKFDPARSRVPGHRDAGDERLRRGPAAPPAARPGTVGGRVKLRVRGHEVLRA
jgi:hypothetical protein